MKKYTLITGGTEGLGLEFAYNYAKNGDNLILISRSYEKLSKTRDELSKYNVDIRILSLDLTLDDSIEKLRDFIVKERLYVFRVINNAGIGCYGLFVNYSDELITDIIQLNIKSLTKITRLSLSFMLKQGEGELLNIASTAAFSPGPLMSLYYATKAYVLNFTQAIITEYKDKNIKISCFCPGALTTKFQEKSGIVKKSGADKLLMDVKLAAQMGVDGLKKGKSIIVPGYKNKMIICASRFLPGSVLSKIILMMNKE